tara:strand:+ start:380 stop:667 length:288 start_codon:yes stop_codon:yes gene_type:complete
MKYFKTEIKLNPTFVASNRIEVSARRYIGRSSRWYAELQDGFHSYEPVEWVQGDLKSIKAFITKWKKSHVIDYYSDCTCTKCYSDHDSYTDCLEY